MGGDAGRRGGRNRGSGRGRGSGSAGAAATGRAEFLTISGCKDGVVGPIIRGNYQLHSENHDRPVYRKDEKVGAAGLDVMLYFWDDRDSPDFSGWWFGPQIGGDEVWAFHADTAAKNPPPGGWQCPFDGPVDSSIQVQPKAEASKDKASAGVLPPGPQPKTKEQPQKSQPQKAAQSTAPLTGAAAKQDEARRKKEQEQMQQQEEISKSLQVEREELEAQRKLELDKLKRLEGEKKRKERHAHLMLRRVLCRLRLAKPETVKDLTAELDKVLVQEASSMPKGARQEADRIRFEAKLRVQKITQCLQKAEQRRKVAEEGRKERDAAMQKLLSQLEVLVQGVEITASELCSKEEGLLTPEVPNAEEVEAFMASVAKADEDVVAAHKACVEFVSENRAAIEQADKGPIRPGKVQIDNLMFRAEASHQKRAAALQGAETAKQAALQRQENARVAAQRKAVAEELVERDRSIFKRYDVDGDNRLSLSEATSYAKSEFGYEVSKDVVSRCMKQAAAKNENDGKVATGISFESFHLLKLAVGIAREVARDRQRQSAKKERLDTLEYAVAEVETLLTKAEASCQNAKEAAEKLQEQDGETSLSELFAKCEEASSLIKSAEEEFETAWVRAEDLAKGDSSGVLLEHRTESLRLANRMSPQKLMLSSSKETLTTCQKELESRRTAEVQALAVRAAALLRSASPKALGTGDELLDGLGPVDGEPLSADELTSFLRTRWDDPPPEEDLVLRWLNESYGTSAVQRSDLWRHIRQCWKVIKSTSLTDGLSVKDSKTLRMLEVGEVVELLGPEELQKDEEAELERIRVRSRDGIEGFVTVKSNANSRVTYLQKGGDRLAVLKETSLAESLEVSGPAMKEPLRQLKVGETLDFMDEETKDQASGLLRVKVRAQSDRACGWATKVGNQGTVFLQQL